MISFTSRNTFCRAAPGVYRLYHQGRSVNEAVSVDSGALYVSHSFTGSGRFVASLRDAARWLEATEGGIPAPLAAA